MATKERWEADGALVRACLSGNEKAWEQLIRRYQRLVYSIPVALGLQPADADEIFQRVAVKLLAGLSGLRKAESIASWLAVTARRECLAQLRERRRTDPLDDESATSSATDPPDIVQDLHRVQCTHALTLALERMGDPCRTLLDALYVEVPPPSYAEISRRLNRPVGSLGPTRLRCLEKLKKLYIDLGGPAP